MYKCICIIDTNRDVYLFLFTCNLILYSEFTITKKIVSSSYFPFFILLFFSKIPDQFMMIPAKLWHLSGQNIFPSYREEV